MPGLLLALDTAGARCSAAVASLADRRLLSRRDPTVGRGHAERLMDVVAEALGEAGAVYADLELIAVTVGPGSFTGLRVGVAAARGLALALRVPAVGVSVLHALAEPHLANGAPAVLVVQDARRGELYAALHGPGDATLHPPAVLRWDDLPSFAAGIEAPFLLAGSAAPAVAERLGLEPARVVGTDGEVDVAAVAALGRRLDPALAPPRPLYLRGADAKPQVSPLAGRAACPEPARARY